MSQYKLNIQFDPQILPVLYSAGEEVIIVKHTSADESAASKHVVWVAFKPFEKNTVEWKTEFAVYASNTKMEAGSVINKLSDKLAASKVNYRFDDGTFVSAESFPKIGANTYAVTNDSNDYKALTFGLAQSVNVNGDAFVNHPINAAVVPVGHTVDMTPYERVDVYLKSKIDDGTVLTHIGNVPLTVEYSGAAVEHTIAYDGSTGRFTPIK